MIGHQLYKTNNDTIKNNTMHLIILLLFLLVSLKPFKHSEFSHIGRIALLQTRLLTMYCCFKNSFIEVLWILASGQPCTIHKCRLDHRGIPLARGRLVTNHILSRISQCSK